MKHIFFLFLIFAGVSLSHAQLVVAAQPPYVSGQKAVVSIALRNEFNEDIKSARAVCFLTDVRGQMVGQSAKWVIGGYQKPGLMAGGTNTFNFIFNVNLPGQTTNLLARIAFNRIILADGRLADPVNELKIIPTPSK